MKPTYILAIDQGTTGSRAFIFNARGQIAGQSYREFKQYYPKPGWVEHDPDEIWASCVDVIKGAIAQARINPQAVAAIGITNQRETTVVWDRKTSKPFHRAIVWQCRRTSQMCNSAALKSLARSIHEKTGLVVDPYFSATKITWLFDHIKGLRARAQQGGVCFGTIDSWLIWKLTGGAVHATDVTNASRTMIFNIRRRQWDPALLKALTIPSSILPKVLNSGSEFGCTAQRAAGLPSGIPITAVMGDQQAALYGQGCFAPGTVKNTYGTGCFLVLNTGDRFIQSKEGLLTTLACNERGEPVFALEGSIFIAGAVMQWLRDELKVISSSVESEALIKGLDGTNGVYFVPAFTGLGASYWDADARGIICGLTRGANVRHIVRAARESIAYQTKDVFDLMQQAYGRKISQLNVDGGACRSDFLMQFQADILGVNILRPKMSDSTVAGAGYLAGVTAGVFNPRDLDRFRGVDARFTPKMSRKDVMFKYEGWLDAVNRARS